MAISCARKSTRGISPDSPPPTPQSATCRHCQPVEAIVKPPETAAKPPASRRSIGLLTKSVVSAVTTRISSIVARHPALDSNDTEKPMESQPSIETQPPITVRPVQSTRLHIPFQKFPPEIPPRNLPLRTLINRGRKRRRGLGGLGPYGSRRLLPVATSGIQTNLSRGLSHLLPLSKPQILRLFFTCFILEEHR